MPPATRCQAAPMEPEVWKKNKVFKRKTFLITKQFNQMENPTKDVWLTRPQWDEVQEALEKALSATKQKHSKVNRDLVRKDELQDKVYCLENIMRKITDQTV
jgi:hypothetical protein